MVRVYMAVYSLLTSELLRGEYSMSCRTYLTTRERNLYTDLRGGCVGTRAGLAIVDMRKFSFSCEKSNPTLPAHSLVTVMSTLSLLNCSCSSL